MSAKHHVDVVEIAAGRSHDQHGRNMHSSALSRPRPSVKRQSCGSLFLTGRNSSPDNKATVMPPSAGRWPKWPPTERIERPPSAYMILPSSLVPSSGMGADGSSTARVHRGPSQGARCASTEDHQPPSPPTVAIYRNLHPRRCGTLPLPDFLRAHRPCRVHVPSCFHQQFTEDSLLSKSAALARHMQSIMISSPHS